MYVRIFNAHELERWKCEKLDDLQIIALEPWSPKGDSDFSVFKINSNIKCVVSNWIVLRALADNFNKRNTGIDLLVLSEELLDKIKINVRDDENLKLNCRHANLKEVTYKQFRLIIEYTFFNSGNVITYSISDIKQLISTLTEKDYKKLISYYLSKHVGDRETKFKLKLKNTYFRDDIANLPPFLND